MRHFFTAGLIFMGLVLGASAQTCSNLKSGCYYTGAGSISAGSANANQYFAIGGLFDIHEKADGEYCGSKISPSGMLNLLAFYWSIDKYSSTLIRSPVAVGAVAFDTCMRPDQTVENILSFSQCKVQIQGLNQQNVVAYVGPYTETDTARTSILAEDLKITLMSPSASQLSMGTKTLRMKPPVNYDLEAIVAFLKQQNSDLVLIVYTKAYQNVHKMLNTILDAKMSKAKTCNKFELMLEEDMSNIDSVANQLIEHSRAKFVVPLMDKVKAEMLMRATTDKKDEHLIYILHSDIGRDGISVDDHAIVVEPAAPGGNDLKSFNDFLKLVKANATKHANLDRPDVVNPWLDAFVQQDIMLPDLENENSVTVFNAWRTIESVRVIIDGMNQGILETCAKSNPNNYQFCDELRNLPTHNDKVYDYIRSDTFKENGELKPEAISYNYFMYSNQDSSFSKIGSISGPNFDVAVITVNLKDTMKYGFAFSGSICPETLDCCIPPTDPPTNPPDTTPVMEKTTEEAIKDTVLVPYPRDKEITGAFSNMERKDEDYGTRFDLGQKWILALGVLAGLGIVCVLVFEIYILYKMVGTRMGNKWRTMWLGQLLLFGIFLSYLVCFAYIFVPTKATCGITRFGVGVAYAICFAVLLVKLMVILTSKSSDVLLPGDVESPNYLKGVYQFLMFAFAVGVQIVINVQWLITVPPEAIRVMSHSGDHVWVCNHYTWKTGDNLMETGGNMMAMDNFVRTNFENHVLSLTYIMVMIIIITVLSLNAHGIITNHRESVFIGIAAGFSIPVWLAWGLVGGLNKDNDYGHEFGDACVAFGLFLTATLILFAMFLPKVRQLVNMGVEGIYLEDDRDTIYGGSVIMAPPSYKSKGPTSVIYVNNQGIYSEPLVIGNGETNKANHLRHPGSTYSAPPTFLKKTQSTYGEGQVLRITDDLKGRHPSSRSKKPSSEINYGYSGRPRSLKGTLPRSRSQSDLGAL